MVQKTEWQKASPAKGVRADWPAEVAGVLGEVQALLEAGRYAAALDRVASRKNNDPWLANAAAVCLLRLGDAGGAADVLRGLVITNGMFLRDDVPAVFKVNFAAALVAGGDLSHGLRRLAEVRDEGHPAVREVRDAVRRWEKEMTFRQRLWYLLGGSPHRPFVPDASFGRLG